LSKPANEVHAIGLAQMESITKEMQAIGERSFGTKDVPGLLQQVRTGRQYLFKSRQELIDYSRAALDRAKAAVPQWFGLVPKADVTLEPYPAFREKNAPNEYNPPAEDGSHPGLFYVSAYQAEKKSRVSIEATAFHETIPGHHMQIALALEQKDIHPIGRYLINSGYVEGWALYAERLADEMKLYSSISIGLECSATRPFERHGWSSIPASIQWAGLASKPLTTCCSTLRKAPIRSHPRSTATSSSPVRQPLHAGTTGDSGGSGRCGTPAREPVRYQSVSRSRARRRGRAIAVHARQNREVDFAVMQNSKFKMQTKKPQGHGRGSTGLTSLHFASCILNFRLPNDAVSSVPPTRPVVS
jgi:hypothetical protein